jgi:hypothetical protein
VASLVTTPIKDYPFEEQNSHLDLRVAFIGIGPFMPIHAIVWRVTRLTARGPLVLSPLTCGLLRAECPPEGHQTVQ